MMDEKKEFTYKMVFFGVVGIIVTTLILVMFKDIV